MFPISVALQAAPWSGDLWSRQLPVPEGKGRQHSPIQVPSFHVLRPSFKLTFLIFQGAVRGQDPADAAMQRSWNSPATTATRPRLTLKLACSCTGWQPVHHLANILASHLRTKVHLGGVKPTSLDFLCQGEGCGRAFASPMGVAIHRLLHVEFC